MANQAQDLPWDEPAQAGDLLSEPPLSSAAAAEPEGGDLKFEAALADLEALVEQLESGQMTLEESLHAYRRGVGLVKLCSRQLTEAEQQVRVLEADLLRPLQAEDMRGDA